MPDELLYQLGTLEVSEEEVVELEVSEGTCETSTYHGEYTIVPKVYETELKTKNKFMSDNILVEKIPYSSVDNLAGGQTLTIGG